MYSNSDPAHNMIYTMTTEGLNSLDQLSDVLTNLSKQQGPSTEVCPFLQFMIW